MSKKLLKQLRQTRGDVITDNPSELENSFKSNSHKISLATKYEDKISSMEVDELQDLAGELGIAKTDNKDFLIKAIKKEFKKS